MAQKAYKLILWHSYWALEKEQKANFVSQKDRKSQFQLSVKQRRNKVYLQPILDTQSDSHGKAIMSPFLAKKE
jgi:hypothetical protein